jgi:hypothetical protein
MVFVQREKETKADLVWSSLCCSCSKNGVLDQESQFMYRGLYLASLCVGSCDVKLCAYCPSQCKLSQLASFQGDGPAWSTPRRFHCSQTWEQMIDNVRKHLSFTFLQVSFLWSTCLSCADHNYLFLG